MTAPPSSLDATLAADGFVSCEPRTDGSAWKAAEAEGHDMTIVACLLRLPVVERLKIHRASLATVDMLRSAVLTNE